MRTSFISITSNIPDTQVALILLGLRASEVMLWSDILAPCTRGPRSGGVIRKTESETRPSTTWHHQWVGHNTEHHSLPWSPTQKYRSPWGFAEMESQPPAPTIGNTYIICKIKVKNCWYIHDIWFRIKYIIPFQNFPSKYSQENLNVVDSICQGLSNTCWTLANSKSQFT